MIDWAGSSCCKAILLRDRPIRRMPTVISEQMVILDEMAEVNMEPVRTMEMTIPNMNQCMSPAWR